MVLAKRNEVVQALFLIESMKGSANEFRFGLLGSTLWSFAVSSRLWKIEATCVPLHDPDPSWLSKRSAAVLRVAGC